MSIIKNDFEKINISKIKNSKNNKKLTVITAYDALFAKLFDVTPRKTATPKNKYEVTRLMLRL